MTKSPKPTPDNPEQSKRFIDMAREIEASNDAEDFDSAFVRVAKHVAQPPKND